MATATIAPVADVGYTTNTLADWSYNGSSWILIGARSASPWLTIRQAITSTPVNGDSGLAVAAANTTINLTIQWDAMPADFGSMDSVTLRWSSVGEGYADDAGQVQLLNLLGADSTVYGGVNPILGAHAQDAGGVYTSVGYNQSVGLQINSNAQAASKTNWDAATSIIQFQDIKNKGGDGGAIILVDVALDIVYTPAAPPVTINPVGSSSASSSDTAQLTTSWPTVTVNPVDSTSASTSDTAQLTATWLPMTVNPVGSTSTSSSDQAQLTVADPPMTVNPVGSTSTSSSDVAQLTTSWPPMTVNPVGSTSLSSSDTAQLTVTGGVPPMTVNPVGSSSLSSADSAALTSPGTPLAVSDLAGTPGSSGEVGLTWSEPVGVQ